MTILGTAAHSLPVEQRVGCSVYCTVVSAACCSRFRHACLGRVHVRTNILVYIALEIVHER